MTQLDRVGAQDFLNLADPADKTAEELISSTVDHSDAYNSPNLYPITISEVESLGPREFLQRIQQLPPSDYSASGTRLFYLTYIIFSSLLSPFLAPLGTLEGIWSYLTWDIRNAPQVRIVNRDDLKRADQSDIATKKILHILDTTEKMAQKMGLGQVVVVYSKDKQDVGTTLYCRYIQFDGSLLSRTEDEIDGWIAIRLAELHRRIGETTLLLRGAYMIVQAIAFRTLDWEKIPLVWMALYGTLKAIELTVRKYERRKVDEKAMRIAGSNDKMVKFLHGQLKRNYQVKHMSIEEIQKIDPQASVEQIQEAKEDLTPQGNSQNPVIIPLTERLEWALNFRPVT